MCIFVTNILFLVFRMASVFVTMIGVMLHVILNLPVELDRAAVQAGSSNIRINFRTTLQKIRRLIRGPFIPIALVDRNIKRPVRNALRRNGWTPVNSFQMSNQYQRIQIGIAHTVLYSMNTLQRLYFCNLQMLNIKSKVVHVKKLGEFTKLFNAKFSCYNGPCLHFPPTRESCMNPCVRLFFSP